jgi:hypothetical protein
LSRSKRSVRDAILNLLFTFGLVAVAMLAAEVEPIRVLGAHVDEAIQGQSWWLPLMIALAAIGGILMLGALLVTLGPVGIMIAVMPMWVTLLMLGLLIYVGIRLFWAP